MERVNTVTRNLKLTAASELVLAGLKFLSRRAFALLLGKEYLGISGLFTDILSMLSLAELGFGVSITYSLYRPVARGDTEGIKSLMQLYRRVYRAVGAVVLAAGLALTPLLPFFVREMPAIPHLPLIYALYVGNAAVSYFFCYRSTLLYVYQQKYIDAAIRAVVSLTATGAQLVVLLLTKSYLWYLLIAIAATLVQGAAITLTAGRLYPFLREKEVRPLPAETLRELRRNVGAMILHRVGAVAVFGTDHLLISRFVGVVTTGLYSNYILVRNFLNMIIEALSGAVTPALGSLNATASREEQRKIFSRLHVLSACLFGWMSICLGCLYDPFIDLWLGAEYRLPRPAVLLIVVNFYVISMRVPVANTKSAMGLFWDERYKSILEAVMNLAVSVLLARRYGITGILAGTLISTLTLPAWIEPLGLYRNGLGLPVKQYVRDYLLYALMTAAAGALTGLACRITPGGAGGFLLKLVLCLALPGAVYLAAARRFFHSREPLLRLMEALPFGRGKRS